VSSGRTNIVEATTQKGLRFVLRCSDLEGCRHGRSRTGTLGNREVTIN